MRTISASTVAVTPAMTVTVAECVVSYTPPTPTSTPLTSVRRASGPGRRCRGEGKLVGGVAAGVGAARCNVVILSRRCGPVSFCRSRVPQWSCGLFKDFLVGIWRPPRAAGAAKCRAEIWHCRAGWVDRGDYKRSDKAGFGLPIRWRNAWPSSTPR